MSSRHDVVIVGAGPAGATAARSLAEHGAKVVLIDRARFPRPKLCGGGLTPKAVALVPPTGLLAIQRWVDRVEIRSRIGRFEMAVPPIAVGMVDRREFDLALVEAAAAAGVDVREGTAVTGAADLEREVEIVTTAGKRVRAAALVVADGEPSRLARAVGLASDPVRRSWPSSSRHRLRPASEAIAPCSAVKCPAGTPVLPQAGSRECRCRHRVAVALHDLRADLDVFTRSLGLPVEPGSIHGHWIPMGLRRGRLVGGRAVLAGDAAGAADPLFAEGIAFALATGVLAARSVGAYLEGQATDLSDYERSVRATLGPRMRQLYAAARLVDWSVSLPLAALRASGRFRRRSAGFVNDFGRAV